MKDLEKNVNYDLTNCTDTQLKQICIWLNINDSSWTKKQIEQIKIRNIHKIGYSYNVNMYMNTEDKTDKDTICATTLFSNDTFSIVYNETIERFKKLGYSIDIIIKGYDHIR